MIASARPVVAALFLAIAVGACTEPAAPAPQDSARVVPAEPLPPIVVPDLSGLAESVQRQIRQRDEELEATLARPSASAGDRAAAYGALGLVLMAAGFNQQAAVSLLHAEALASADVRWPYYVGHAYLRSGDRGHAASAFDRALKLRPNDLNALIWLGETMLDDDRLPEAQSAFQRAVAVQPRSAAALFGAGRTALARQDYSNAAQFLERALAVDASASAIHYPLAMAYRGLGDTQKTEDHLRRRGSSYPALADPLMEDDQDVLESAVSFENRGMSALKSADFRGAIAAFRKGLDLNADDVSLRYWLGAALYASGDADAARREFADVVRRDPDHAQAHFSLGAIYEAKHQRPQAIAEYEASVRADPKLPESRVRLAEALRASGRLDAAVEQYQAAVQLDPMLVDAWIGGARALIDLKRTDQANDWLARAKRLYPNRPEFSGMLK